MASRLNIRQTTASTIPQKGNPYEVTNYGYPDDVLFSFFGRYKL